MSREFASFSSRPARQRTSLSRSKPRQERAGIFTVADKTMDLDTPIAELEPYGLSVRTIGLLECKLKAVYFRDLVKVTRKHFFAERGLNDSAMAEIRKALRNFSTGKSVKSPKALYGITQEEYDRGVREVWKEGFRTGRRMFPPKSPDNTTPPKRTLE